MNRLIIPAIFILFSTLIGCAVSVPVSTSKGTTYSSTLLNEATCAWVKAVSTDKEATKPEYYTKILKDAGFTGNIMVYMEPRYPKSGHKDSVNKVMSENNVKTIFEFWGQTTSRDAVVVNSKINSIGALLYTYNPQTSKAVKTSTTMSAGNPLTLSNMIRKKFK